MQKFLNFRQWIFSIYWVHAALFALALILWPIFAEMELFEAFYYYSRAHEDWDLDEIALLVVNLTVALIISSVHQSFRLKRLAREREFEYDRAERNACHDPLTGLMNRRAFSITAGQIAMSMPPNSHRILAMIDLDRFKPVNDLLGHAAGDATLRAVAARLEQALRPDDVVARLGGDEFAIIFDPVEDVSTVERTTRRVLHALSQPYDHEGHPIHISASIGLVNWTADMKSTSALARADKALYKAKGQGRAGFAWYDAELDRISTEMAQIETALRHAIRTDAIEPWFQPIVDIETGGLSGFEVLARWIDPDRGYIPPSTFIEIAEDSGQIGALGASLLCRACKMASGWDPTLNISFNLSPLQFHDPQLVQGIKDILRDSGFDPARLTIEVTESSVIQDFSSAADKLMALKALGIKVALDDFGTGYSSLSSLRQLPFDRIKIDRGFVTDIGHQPQNQKIVTGIMALAKGLDLDVTAEGIESQTDLAFLHRLGCSLGQGFLFEEAVNSQEVEHLLATRWAGNRVDLPGPISAVSS